MVGISALEVIEPWLGSFCSGGDWEVWWPGFLLWRWSTRGWGSLLWRWLRSLMAWIFALEVINPRLGISTLEVIKKFDGLECMGRCEDCDPVNWIMGFKFFFDLFWSGVDFWSIMAKNPWAKMGVNLQILSVLLDLACWVFCCFLWCLWMGSSLVLNK